MSLHRVLRVSLLGTLLFAGCGDDLDSSASFGAPPANGMLVVTARGGDAAGGAAGNGGGGGTITAICRGNVFIGLNPAPLPPPLPATPAGGTPVPSWSNTQTISTGSARVEGNITASSSDTTATLTVADGDLIVNGTITCSAEVSLVFNVSGTVFLNGTVRTGRVDGVPDGDNGGNFFIFARRILFTGSVDTRGEDNPAGNGGWGGSVNFCTDGDRTAEGTGQTTQLYVGGSINMAGGTGAGPGARGGVGGNFQTSRNLFDDAGGHFSGAADGVVHVSGTDFNVSGGSAEGSGKVVGGSAGFMYWMADSGFFFNGTVLGNGGGAVSTDGEAAGASGSAIFVQEFTIGDSGPIAVYGSIAISGGDAVSEGGAKTVGGQSGFMYLINGTDMNFGGGALTLRGGDSTARGGDAGGVSITIPNGTAGDIYVDTAIDASSGNGAGRQISAIAGGVTLSADLGDIYIAGSMALNGGSGSGDAAATGPSAGGLVKVTAGTGDLSDGGSITFVGSITANGGSDSNEADATNGASGGKVDFICNNAGGSIYLDPGSTVQLDGGNAGGGALGGFGGIVTLRTTGGDLPAGTFGGNVNLRGSIVARGGSGGGSGGRVIVQSDKPLVPPDAPEGAGDGPGDGRGGHITLHAGATIDLSGGGGGGDGLNDGLSGASFPVAVMFDADGNNSDRPDENGIVRNLGLIISRGAPADGNGGDVRFDGLNAVLSVGPDPGSLDLAAAGAGIIGGFRGE